MSMVSERAFHGVGFSCQKLEMFTAYGCVGCAEFHSVLKMQSLSTFVRI